MTHSQSVAMKKRLLTTTCFLLSLILGVACSSQQAVQQNETDTKSQAAARSDQTGPEKAMGPGIRLWAWSELRNDEGDLKTTPFIQNNEIVSQSIGQNGRIPVPAGSFLTLEIDVSAIDPATRSLSVEWILKPSGKDPRQAMSMPNQYHYKSHWFDIDFESDFDAIIHVIKGGVIIASRQLLFTVATPPSIKIVQPSNDIIVAYEQSVKLVANAVDGAGNFPPIVWTVKNEAIERFLGLGNELETSAFDIGYNKVTANAIDFDGTVMKSDPIHVIIPYQAVKTRIETPKKDQAFEWNQPVRVFARGNDLEYALQDADELDSEPTFTPGSGFLKPTLPPGRHRITFRGEFGTDSLDFIVKDKLQDIAEVTRVEGHVIMSGEQGEWKKVSKGDRIPEGFIVRSINNGLAEIHLNNGVVYILNRGNAIRILPNGNIVKNLSREDLALYSLTDPENIKRVEKNLSPMISQLRVLLKNHEIEALEAENRQDIIHLLDLIFKGQLQIDEVTVE